MAGILASSELTGVQSERVTFALASEADDAGIRRLLRETPMAGRISVALQREPDFFTEARRSRSSQQTVVAREGNRIICVGGASTRVRFVNGAPRRVAYLSGLRLDGSMAGRSDILRQGYAFFWESQHDGGADCYFTSIASENGRAIRLLERGIPGLPRYEFLSEFVTVLIPVRGCRGLQTAEVPGSGGMRDLVEWLNEKGSHHQFAPCWTADEIKRLEPLGLRAGDFRILRKGSKIVACGAVWDQRSFKQTVVHGYAPFLARARPFINLAARMTGRPGLPAPGMPLAHAVISHLAVEPGHSSVLLELIRNLLQAAAGGGLEFLTAGFAGSDPRLEIIRRHFACREYRSRIYAVPRPGKESVRPDDRLPFPEIALL